MKHKPLKVPVKVPLSSFRAQLAALIRQARRGQIIKCTRQGEAVAFLAPLSAAASLAAVKSLELSTADFRSSLSENLEALECDADLIYLTFHRKRRCAVVSARFEDQLLSQGQCS